MADAGLSAQPVPQALQAPQVLQAPKPPAQPQVPHYQPVPAQPIQHMPQLICCILSQNLQENQKKMQRHICS